MYIFTWNVGCFLLGQFSVFKLILSKGDSPKVCGLGYALKALGSYWYSIPIRATYLDLKTSFLNSVSVSFLVCTHGVFVKSK